jgi:hypothetical protein
MTLFSFYVASFELIVTPTYKEKQAAAQMHPFLFCRRINMPRVRTKFRELMCRHIQMARLQQLTPSAIITSLITAYAIGISIAPCRQRVSTKLGRAFFHICNRECMVVS